jgi:S-adenosylmethionine:tRNA ribosyltransferase-isomerase
MTTLLDTFAVPAGREADRPPEARGLARDQVRLLVADGDEQTHARFRELPHFLRPGDLLVVNNSATIPAAVDVATADGPGVLHFSTQLDDGRWAVELRTPHGRPWPHPIAPNTRIRISEKAALLLQEPWLPPARRLWIAQPDFDVAALLIRHGHPIRYAYLHEHWSMDYYRTVFGRHPGSAEMPSAARPFTQNLVTVLVSSGIAIAPITLHTGVSSPELGERPGPEPFAVTESTARLTNSTRAAGGRVIAVGTTVTRALESAADEGLVHPASGWTDLVLSPDRPARTIDGIITGWHAPGASHLQLLQSVAGCAVVDNAYRTALDAGYLWHEFGDSALLIA